jgi:hypothetical protein
LIGGSSTPGDVSSMVCCNMPIDKKVPAHVRAEMIVCQVSVHNT